MIGTVISKVKAMVPPSTISKKRVFYAQPSSVKVDLMPHYQRLGKALDVKPAAIRAIAIVESNEKPFTEGGFPIVRFEAHHWVKHRVASKAALTFDRLKNAKDLDARWTEFEAMRDVNEGAAILSHSFGAFQIMGFNYKACLCADPVAFLAEQMTVEGQFKMLHRFVLNNPPLLSALRKGDAQKVALHYNGPAFARNKYDVNWAAASKAGGAGAWA